MLKQNHAADSANAQAAHAQNPATRLVDYSPSDKPWDTHRAECQTVEGGYRDTEFNALASRMRACSGFLGFRWITDQETGEISLRLGDARFCRVRHCPVCQWRRSLMWQARFLGSLPEIEAEYPRARWLFLTLTVQNMPLPDLRGSLQAMNQAWQRLIKRHEFSGNVVGWIRTTEVTRAQNSYAHPHFHCLLMVKPSYFKKGYVRQERWSDLWRECARLDYQPIVDIRAVKSKTPGDNGLRRAVSETLKYAVKPQDMRDAWLIGLTKQVHKLRFIASGGALKNVLRETDETEDDLLLADESSEPDADKPQLYFDWQRREKHYTKR